MLSSLAQNGAIALQSRYVLQKGILVDAGTALTANAIGSITANGQYLVLDVYKRQVLYTLWRQNVSKRLKNRGITEEVVMQPPEDLDPGKARIRKPKMFRIKKEKKAKETVPEQVSAGEEPKSQEKPE